MFSVQLAAVMAHCSSMSEAPHQEPPVSRNRTQLCSNGVTGPPAEQCGERVNALRAALEGPSTEETTSIPLPAHARTAHVHVTRMVMVWRTAHNGGNNTAWRELWVGRRLVEDRSTVVHELDDRLVLRRRRGGRPRKIRRLRR